MAPFRYALALLGAVASAGCGMSLPKGARSLFSATHTCPAEGVTVQPRPDVPQHSLLTAQRSAKPIPPEVAANPERLALWNKMHPSADADLDRAGTTYEVSGCGHTTLYVCDHPSVAAVMVGSPSIVGDASVISDDVTALSAVECLPPLGALQDVAARVQGADVVHLPPHTALPAVAREASRTARPLARQNHRLALRQRRVAIAGLMTS